MLSDSSRDGLWLSLLVWLAIALAGLVVPT